MKRCPLYTSDEMQGRWRAIGCSAGELAGYTGVVL